MHFDGARGFAVSCPGTRDGGDRYLVEFQPLGREWFGSTPPIMTVRADDPDLAVRRAVGALLLLYDEREYTLRPCQGPC